MEQDTKLQSKATREYEEFPVIKKIPIVIYYHIEKSVGQIPNGIKKIIAGGCSLLSIGHLAFCTAVPFVYIYRRDKNITGDSILGADRAL
ncbi:hypothetical protein P7C65_03s3g03420 [Encephalitozoon intestinalis]|nr:hypothetical protein GPK93_03g03680 [Encephalitozoon intestinalis]